MTFMDAVVHIKNTHPLLFTLGILMAIDIVSGTLAAGMERKISSKVSMNGMMRKAMVVMFCGMAAAVERAQPDVPLIKLCSIFFIYTEALSIVENAKRAGIPIPAFVANSFSQRLKSSSDDKSEGIHLEGDIKMTEKKS